MSFRKRLEELGKKASKKAAKIQKASRKYAKRVPTTAELLGFEAPKRQKRKKKRK